MVGQHHEPVGAGAAADTTTDEVSAILAAIGVMGADRDRTMRMARREAEQGWWEENDVNLSDQARTYLQFERRATRITDVELLLVPGLLQTPEYTHALLVAFGVDKSQIPGRIARRMGRQDLLERASPPQATFVLTELAMRQPLGGRLVMAQQLRRIVHQAQRPHVVVRVIPKGITAHPVLLGGFVVLEFADDPAVVYVEGRRSGLFPDSLAEIEAYRLDAERSTDLALTEQESLDLLLTIAEDLEGGIEYEGGGGDSHHLA